MIDTFHTGNKIGKKLMVMIIAFSSLVTFFITALQLFWDYRQQLSDLDTSLNTVSINVPTITNSLWNFDEDQLKLSLEGLVNLLNIEHASITTEDQNRLWQAGKAESQHVVKRTYQLISKKRKEPIEIGTLSVTASLDAIYERVMAKALGILLSNAVKTFLVALFMFALTYYFITKRIYQLTRNVENLADELSLPALSLPAPEDGEKDEIQLVQDRFDDMAQRLRRAHEEREENQKRLQDAYQEVTTINKELEQRVHERTQHLSQEIIEREYIQQSLTNSEQRLRDIAESASDWFWETGPDHLFTYLSGRCYEVTGFKPEDVIGRKRYDLADFSNSTEKKDDWESYEEILRNELPLDNFHYRLETQAGKILHVELSGRPYYDGAGTFMGYRGAARDITDQVNDSEILRHAKEDADQASKAKSEFISNISHELRTPLNGILGFAQLLDMNKNTPLNKQQHSYVEHIINAGRHLLELINDILDLSKIEAGKMQLSLEALSPVEVIETNLDILQTLAQKHQVTLETDFSQIDRTVRIKADATRFRQILINLCNNAIKYNKENGLVKISLSQPEKDWLRIAVSDTGPGLDEQQLQHLFTPFNRLGAENSTIEGSGVGLSITKKLVDLMAGHIGVESVPTQGSTFWFEFKTMAQTKTPQPFLAAPKQSASPLSLLACRILYIEDNPENMTLLQEIFENFEDAQLLCATTAEAGIAKARETQPDLILMDINLPDFDGFEAFKKLLCYDETRTIPVIALSANAHPDTIKHSKIIGFSGFLTKPIDIPKLIQTINHTIANTRRLP